MTRVALLAMARPGHGGTLPYTLSMIEALRQLPRAKVAVVIHTQADNHEYDACGFEVRRLPGLAKIVAGALAGPGLFADADVVLAPIYSTVLLATRRPFAFTLHDLQEKYLPENFGPATRAWREVANRLLTARARRIVCESEFVKADIVRFFQVPAARIAVIPAPPRALLGGDATLDPTALAAAHTRLGLPAMYLFYPAQFWPHKNHVRLVEAFALVAARFPGCALVLTGKPRDAYATVVRRSAELGLADKVRHVGHVSAEELVALYRAATAVVVPTLFESISIPVYEAFALGVPVCASAVVALPEQIGDAGVLFDPLSVDDMAAKIESVLADPALRRQLVERGHERMRAVTQDAYAARLDALIDDLAAATS